VKRFGCFNQLQSISAAYGLAFKQRDTDCDRRKQLKRFTAVYRFVLGLKKTVLFQFYFSYADSSLKKRISVVIYRVDSTGGRAALQTLATFQCPLSANVACCTIRRPFAFRATIEKRGAGL